MCSFGGKILPRPSDGKLRYVGGETRIVSVSRDILYVDLIQKMTDLYGQHLVALRYQLPGEDLDALVSVMSDEDVENMMEEYDKLDASEGSSRLRVFLLLNGVEMGGEGGLLDFSDSCANPLFLPDFHAQQKMGQVEKRIIDPPLAAQVDSNRIFAERVPQVQPGIRFNEVLPHRHQGTIWEPLTSPNQGIPPRAMHIENFPQELMDSDAPNECGRVYQIQKGHHYDDTLRANPGHMPFYNAQESDGQFLGEAFEISTTNMNAYNNGHPRVGTINYKEEAFENKLGFNGVSSEDYVAADLLSAHFAKALDMPLNPSRIDGVSLDAHLTTHPTIFMGEAMSPSLEEGIYTPQITEGRPIFPVIDSLLLQGDQGNVVTQGINQKEIEGKKADSGTCTTYQPTLFSLPTLSIQNWENCLAQTELEEQVAMIDLQDDKNCEEVKLEEVSSEKKGGEAAFEELRIGGNEMETDNARQNNPDDVAAAAESEAISRGLQIVPNSDLEELRELGSGNFGTVYHGKWRGTDVAIKRIKSSCFSGRSAERDRLVVDFWQEACILSQLHHPNVLAFYGVAPDGPDRTLATITEYMVNGSLKQALQKDRGIDQRKRLLIAMDVAFGMEYLHGKNIIHFDLKCDNLLVNMRDPQRPICKVGDLGLSKVKHQTMVSGGVRGTLPWMAPELLNGSSGLVSEKVDVFSFGIVMWELLTGEEPYANMHYGAIIGGIVSNTLRPPIPSLCEPAWRSLMELCWSADPSERPSFSEIARLLRSMAASSLQAS